MSSLQHHLALFSEPMRVRLLVLLELEELGVGELTRIVQVPQSTVSRHLKELRVAGWIRRRSEGTAGLFRFDPDDVGADSVRLWAIVRDDFRDGRMYGEDAARLATVLESRTEDSRSFFGRLRGQWEQVRRELFGDAFAVPTFLSLLPEGMVVADLGCGTGESLVLLSPVVERVIGVDREQGMLDVAAERTSELVNVDLRRGGLDDLPLASAEVDAVLCMLVLHHVAQLDRAFSEMRRITRPGGRIVILDMMAHDRHEYRQTMGHVHLGFSETTLREAATEAGLVLQSWRALPPAQGAQGPPLFVAVLAGAR